MYFFYSVCFKPNANPTVINENIKEIHILVAGVILEFPILNHMLLRRDNCILEWWWFIVEEQIR